MPINLTTPLTAVQDSYGVSQYNQYQARIDPNTNDKVITVYGEFGNTVGGEWQPAHPYGRRLPPEIWQIRNIEADPTAVPPIEADPVYDNLIAGAVALAVGELGYAIVKRATYEWIQSDGYLKYEPSNPNRYAGTIV